MGEAKNIMFGFIITLGLMGLFGFFISSTLMAYNTPLPAQYNKTLTLMANTSLIDSDIQTQRDYLNKLNKTSSEFTLFDIGGYYFQEGLAPLKLFFRSLNIFEGLMSSGVTSLQDTEFGHAFNLIGKILKSLLVLGMVFIFLAVLLKWEL